MRTEHDHQVALFKAVKSLEGVSPSLSLMYAVPNAGRRTPRQGAYMKAEGLRPGVPDICLPVARKGFHGLYIELKRGNNKPTENQWIWLTRLQAANHHVAVCYSCNDALDVVLWYMDIKGVY